MAVNLKGKKQGKEEEPKKATGNKPPTSTKAKPKPTQKTASKPGSKGGFMRGKAAQEGLEKAEAERERKAAEAGKTWTFSIKPGDETEITFLDGDLDEDGILDVPAMWRHEFYQNGQFSSYVCLETNPEWGPCPICETGDTPSYVTVYTVIDHSQYEGRDNKIHENQKRILIAKTQTTKQLQKIAQKEGGLAGMRFEVSRSQKKAPRVGDMFYPGDKYDLADVRETFGEEMVPVDYAEEFEVFSREDLLGMGFQGTTGVGETGGTVSGDYEDNM